MFCCVNLYADTIVLNPGETYTIEQHGYDDLSVSEQVDRVIPAVFVFLLVCVI